MAGASAEKTLDVVALAAVTGLTRFAFRSHYLYDIDSVNFALALRRFDPSVHQPHPPGYFLYICLGRLANLIFHDANTSLVAISIVFSCGAGSMVYVLTDSWFGRKAALFAGFIFLFSPLAWFHGTVALTYIVEAFFSALVGYMSWRVDRGAERLILPAAAIVGISAGFRPSSILFLAPLWLFSLRNARRKQAAAGIGALTLTMLAWFIPMIRIGGAKAYISSFVSLWLTVPSKTSVFNSSIIDSFARAVIIAGIYLLCFGCAAILPVLAATGSSTNNHEKVVFTRVWIAPGLLFFTFVYLKFVNSGYLLVLMPPVCVWMGLWASELCEKLHLSKISKLAVIGGCAAVNVSIFLWAPIYCSYREVRRFEAELGDVIEVLPRIASAKDTLIVGLDSHYLGYRHAGYYLPGYLTIQFPEVQLASGMRVFAMRDRDTGLESRLTTSSIRNFVIFPLPPDDKEYNDYMTLLRKRFPAGDLHLIERGGNQYAIGPVADLRFLFPVAASPTVQVMERQRVAPEAIRRLTFHEIHEVTPIQISRMP